MRFGDPEITLDSRCMIVIIREPDWQLVQPGQELHGSLNILRLVRVGSMAVRIINRKFPATFSIQKNDFIAKLKRTKDRIDF
jgi:hypothetical protein